MWLLVVFLLICLIALLDWRVGLGGLVWFVRLVGSVGYIGIVGPSGFVGIVDHIDWPPPASPMCPSVSRFVVVALSSALFAWLCLGPQALRWWSLDIQDHQARRWLAHTFCCSRWVWRCLLVV